MIDEAFLHCFGIGPVRLAKLREQGVRRWSDAVQQPEKVPAKLRKSLVKDIQECLAALSDRDIGFFVNRLAGPDRWRILTEFIDETSYFDIETFGLEYDAPITTIVCWHQGDLHTFVEHENLDDFLDLLEDVKLLASFNGSSFDVPRVLDTFHIPSLPCPHIDLRWLCYHYGLRGGLKDITVQTGFSRPSDLSDADGELAIRLWQRWQHRQDRKARDMLVRYCASDVVLLVMLARKLSGKENVDTDQLWASLPKIKAA